MLLKRFLHSDGIEKELALIFRFLRPAAVAARLRHVIPPFLIQARQLLEFVLEIVVRGRLGAVWAIEARLIRQFFEHGVCLHFLLNQIAQLEQRGLQDEKALLELRCENLLQGKILRLVHSVSGHAPNLPMQLATSKQFALNGPVVTEPVLSESRMGVSPVELRIATGTAASTAYP